MDVKMIYTMFFGAMFGCYAQNDSLQNPYFKSYSDKIISSIYYLDTSNNFEIGFDVEGKKKYLELIPNRQEQLGFNLSYKFIDVSFGFAPKFFAENKDNSNSKLFSFNTRFYHKKWMQSVTFINQKGFFISDDEVQVALPHMRSTKIGGTTSYIFNENFSYKTLVNQNQWQTKSAGSFIPTFSFYFTNIDFNTDPNASINAYVFSLAPSYFYNFVISNRFLIAPGVGVGAGINDIEGDVSALYEFDVNLKLAYNTNSFFAFASVNSLNYIQDTSSPARLDDNISTLKFTVGYRFNTPKKVAEVYEKVNKKIGL